MFADGVDSLRMVATDFLGNDPRSPILLLHHEPADDLSSDLVWLPGWWQK
jgi:hypothetical protein